MLQAWTAHPAAVIMRARQSSFQRPSPSHCSAYLTDKTSATNAQSERSLRPDQRCSEIFFNGDYIIGLFMNGKRSNTWYTAGSGARVLLWTLGICDFIPSREGYHGVIRRQEGPTWTRLGHYGNVGSVSTVPLLYCRYRGSSPSKVARRPLGTTNSWASLPQAARIPRNLRRQRSGTQSCTDCPRCVRCCTS